MKMLLKTLRYLFRIPSNCTREVGHDGPCNGWCCRETSAFDKKALACQSAGTRYYGDGGTIHSSATLDVEVCDGRVVAVWFRCQALPFRQSNVGAQRACEMRGMTAPELHGVEVRDKP